MNLEMIQHQKGGSNQQQTGDCDDENSGISVWVSGSLAPGELLT
jgi:hypothetical protein